MIENVDDENSKQDAKAWNEREESWQSSLSSSFISSNDPPRPLFIWINDVYSIFKRATGGKMVVQP